ncbi:cytochrome P450 [Massariosphaeria phaeospora]|uniref:Cytochrome P450 n=1 Tax=Massariosphaeria phaeospora TaxID=100035 RepID=A0A7C8IJ80_9PLEO|nr:cytochrome P450 [Massariosphaeria phaeospora]
MASILVLVLVLLAVYVLKKLCFDRRKREPPLPPGPPGLPLVGNIKDLPAPGVPEYLHWFEHKDRYGPLSSVTVLGQAIIIIHDKKVALELMDKRGAIHSGRPKMKFGFDMVGWINTLSSLQYNATHRLYRKYAYLQLGSKAAVSRYNSLQEAIAGRLLWRINRGGGTDLTQHLRTEAAELMLKILYDYTIEQDKPDPLVDQVDRVMDQFGIAILPGRWAVDIFPFLEHVPEWMPGANFKRTARVWKKTLLDCANMPYQYVKQHKLADKSEVSWVARSIKESQSEGIYGPNEEHAIKWTAISLFTGGADTTVGTINAFFLAMSMFPEVQRKAQEEIDRVVGTARLPSFSDRDSLPYVNAVMEEALRWHPLTTMGLPHATDKDDEINGYRIPKGALLLPAVWWFTRDPTVYHDPESFKPERFSEPYNEPSATNVFWGFGRRICPGRVLADSSLYLNFVQALAAFDIRKAVDQNGIEIEPVHEFESGIIGRPAPFTVKVTPRSKEHQVVLEGMAEKYPPGASDARYLQKPE